MFVYWSKNQVLAGTHFRIYDDDIFVFILSFLRFTSNGKNTFNFFETDSKYSKNYRIMMYAFL